MEGMLILPFSCLHDVAVEHIYSLPGSKNSNRGRQGRGFGGVEGGGGYPRPPEVSQMEGMLILPNFCYHNIAVKRLVFLSHNPIK